jgi:hypothetical protein
MSPSPFWPPAPQIEGRTSSLRIEEKDMEMPDNRTLKRKKRAGKGRPIY